MAIPLTELDFPLLLTLNIFSATAGLSACSKELAAMICSQHADFHLVLAEYISHLSTTIAVSFGLLSGNVSRAAYQNGPVHVITLACMISC